MTGPKKGELARAAARLAQWRQGRVVGERIPEPLWNLAVALAAGGFVDRGLTGFDLAGAEEMYPDPLLHREAFEAARWCIDTLKATVPIWKKERWRDGEDWGLAATELREVPGPSGHLSGEHA